MFAIPFRAGFRLALLTGLVWLAAAFDAQAQRGRIEGSISKLKCYNERTPSFPSASQGNKGSRDDWCRIDLEFETKTAPNEGWIDEIEIKWMVLAEIPGEKRAILMTLSTFYTDVEDGKHNASAYLKPKFFKRHMNSNRPVLNRLSLYAEILAGGQTIARQEVKSSGRVPDNWFRNQGGLANELLPKRLTPFAHFDYDYYEHEKVTP